MAELPLGGLKVATTIPIETATPDNDDELKANIAYRPQLRFSTKTIRFPVEDPEQTFQRLLNVREVARKKTLNQLKVNLVAGEDGVAGAIYEGNWHYFNKSTLTRLTIVATENAAEYKRLEIAVKHLLTTTGQNRTEPETWIFEVKQGEADGAWEVVFTLKHHWELNAVERMFVWIPVGLFCLLQIVIAIVLFPVTIYAITDAIKSTKEQILPLYRYLLGIEGATRQKPPQRVALPVKQRTNRKKGLTETDELAKLFELFKAGALTKEEYEIQKGKIIGV